MRPQLVRDGDRSRADIEKNEVYKTLWFCSRQAQVALEAASECFSCVGESRFSHPRAVIATLGSVEAGCIQRRDSRRGWISSFLKPARSRMLVGVHKRNIHLCFSAYVPKDAQHTLNGFSSCVESLRLPSEQASSALSGVFRRS